MSQHHPTEKKFEDHIEEHLLVSGYKKKPSEDYDKTNCLITDEVFTFITNTQPDEIEKLENQLGDQARIHILNRLSKEINQRGVLDVLRKGIKTRGCDFRLVYFKPASGMNPEHQKLYGQNQFTVIRQLKYSQKNENSLDLGLFVNGIPIITAELKNSLTGQFVEDAIKQYKQDRGPKEPLFKFKRCLVHFAVGNEEVFMTTRLSGEKTYFLPFNIDIENPVNPDGFKTHYIWEDIWQPDTLLELLQNYLHLEKITERAWNDKKKTLEEKTKEVLIFPRFHQLDVTRKLLAATKQEGAGNHYLIQHSAGSGKSNSIAWLSHQLSSLYQSEGDKQRLFDSIIVVTDRRLLDRQLQNTIKQFEQTSGVVAPIETDSKALKSAIESGKHIIITTLQKFAVISKTTASQPGKKYAVIIDEAHSSQSGESAKHLNETLASDLEHAEDEDKTEESIEDKILDDIESRSRAQPNISYFAFTATPKNKTLEIFGRPNIDGKKVAFHTYTMHQAISEGFILDVLKNYTTFKRYFKLMGTGDDSEEYEKAKAVRVLTEYVDLQPHAIETKTRIVLEHFHLVVSKAIEGKGRAMFVTRSRLHAVKYFQMFSKLMSDEAYKPLVAFSGTVTDPDSGESHTEKSLNGLSPRVDIADALKMPEYRILVVANKYQTGFDESMLHTMYVDKKLGDVNAVQTLSRLNRTMTGKTNCLVLDFVNDAADIQESFQPYYQTTLLEESTEPDNLYDLQDEIYRFEIFTKQDVDELAEIFWDTNKALELLQPILDRIRDHWRQREENEREEFRSKLQSFNRLYSFLSQVISFKDIELEKFYVFVRLLNRKLDKRDSQLPTELVDAVDLDSFRIDETFKGSLTLLDEDGEVAGISGSGGSTIEDPETDVLSNIIEALNEAHGLNLTEEDKVDMVNMKSKVDADNALKAVFTANNTEQAKRDKFEKVVDEIILGYVHTKLDLYKKLNHPQANSMLKKKWFEEYNNNIGSMR